MNRLNCFYLTGSGGTTLYEGSIYVIFFGSITIKFWLGLIGGRNKQLY